MGMVGVGDGHGRYRALSDQGAYLGITGARIFTYDSHKQNLKGSGRAAHQESRASNDATSGLRGEGVAQGSPAAATRQTTLVDGSGRLGNEMCPSCGAVSAAVRFGRWPGRGLGAKPVRLDHEHEGTTVATLAARLT